MSSRVLVLKHVPWEGPHRIALALERAGLEVDTRCVLSGDQLPAHAEVAGAVVMGGPMNVDQVDTYPGLTAERDWIAAAHKLGMPLLGVCLGSQLIARALGSAVWPGDRPELGWKQITVMAADDRLLGHLAPSCEVLHWHGDVFDLPPGAQLLASSEQTPVQAFRSGNSWGLLFHAEADSELTELWLAEPTMREEALEVLGEAGTAAITTRAAQLDAQLKAVSDPMFESFAQLIAERASAQA